MQTVGREELFNCSPILQLGRVKGLYLSAGHQLFCWSVSIGDLSGGAGHLGFIIFPARKRSTLFCWRFLWYMGTQHRLVPFKEEKFAVLFTLVVFLLTASSIRAVSLGDRNIHIFISQKKTQIQVKFPFALGSCEWESPKESLLSWIWSCAVHLL